MQLAFFPISVWVFFLRIPLGFRLLVFALAFYFSFLISVSLIAFWRKKGGQILINQNRVPHKRVRRNGRSGIHRNAYWRKPQRVGYHSRRPGRKEQRGRCAYCARNFACVCEWFLVARGWTHLSISPPPPLVSFPFSLVLSDISSLFTLSIKFTAFFHRMKIMTGGLWTQTVCGHMDLTLWATVAEPTLCLTKLLQVCPIPYHNSTFSPFLYIFVSLLPSPAPPISHPFHVQLDGHSEMLARMPQS